jgi:uncharacterized protein (TIGR00290 family)
LALNKVAVSWSGGKDSMLMFHQLVTKKIPIYKLFTTIDRKTNRTISHHIRRELLFSQVHSLGFPLEDIFLPSHPTNEQYENVMNQFYTNLEKENVDQIAFGDLFLQDIRTYREKTFIERKISPIFPIWGMNSSQLANELIQLGYRAVIVAINSEVLSTKLLGMDYDKDFLRSLPAGCDVCGENGEFHTFVYDGPLFQKPITFRKGEIYQDGSYYWMDLYE